MQRLRNRLLRSNDEGDSSNAERLLDDGSSPSKMPQALTQGDDASTVRVVNISDAERNSVYHYCDNTIQTSKYSLFPLSIHFVIYKNLAEQFQKAANLYFLGISIIQVIPGLSPTGQFTTLIPLCVVVILTMIKDFWEDWKRRVQDRDINNKKSQVFRSGSWTEVAWAEVQVGDLLLVKKGDSIPADLVCVWSSEPEGNCFIETASLDGETNLKLRKSTQAMVHHLSKLPRDSEGRPVFKEADIAGRIVCETPNTRLYNFTGVIERDRQPRVPLNADNILLRGSDLRNVKFVLGIAIFTGADSKLARNMTSKYHKTSRVDATTNRQIFLVFILQLFICIIGTIGFRANMDNFADMWFLAGSLTSDITKSAGTQFVTFLILFNSFIPISLYIMMEVVKVVQGSLINSDVDMYHLDSNTPAQVRNSKINEEFGQVEYIFSDKTGTLTCNRMEFRRFSVTRSDPQSGNISAVSYGEGSVHGGAQSVSALAANESFGSGDGAARFRDHRINDHAWLHETNRDEIRRLLEAMAVCNTVIPEREAHTTTTTYQASSPDEGCLVAAARDLGVELVARTERSVTIRHGKERQDQVWEVLHIIEFSSARKRMSVVCRDPFGRLQCITKGADSVILKNLKREPVQDIIKQQTNHLLTNFATDGLRTLVYAKLDLTDEMFKRWKKKYDNVPLADNREQRLDEIAMEIESEMQLIGTTAIEDRLQDAVPETIELLSRAGIRLWVLTGDRQETAVNIAYSCNLLTKDMGMFTFDQCNAENIRSALEKYMSDVESAALEVGQDIGLVIEGSMLDHVLPKHEADDENEINADLFVSLAIKCKSVICCRVSPIQKAMIVEAVKARVSGVTLAIGDGANDVSMIQMAHVGVGISGVEGLQAARVSDCSISQFRFLQRLVLVHGRWNYRRITRLIIFTFYKNMTLYMTQFWFALYNQFSGQTLYDAWALSMYNLAFSALPIMSLAVFDKDVEAHRLLSTTQFPELYHDSMKGRYFNTKEFWKYSLNAVVHSLFCFFLTLYGASDLVDVDSGTELGLVGHAIVAYSIILNVVTLKCAIEVNTWTLFNALLFILSIFFWYLFLIVYCILYRAVTFNDFASWYAADTITLRHPCYWLLQLVVVVVTLLRDVAYKYYRKNYEPRLFHVVQEFEDKVGTFNRTHVKRETPWLFPKQELKAFKPTLRSSTGANRFEIDKEQDMMEELKSHSSFYPPVSLSVLRTPGALTAEASAGSLSPSASVANFQSVGVASGSPGRRRKKISEIIEECAADDGSVLAFDQQPLWNSSGRKLQQQMSVSYGSHRDPAVHKTSAASPAADL